MSILKDIWLEHLARSILVDKTQTLAEYLSDIRVKIASATDESEEYIAIFFEFLRRNGENSFDSSTVKQIVGFIVDQSYDHTDYPMFNILNMLVGWESFPHGYTALEILYYILECNTLQYYVKKEDRLEAIHTMVKLVEKNDPALHQRVPILIGGLSDSMEGEKHPDVLLEFFKLAKLMIANLKVDEHTENVDRILDRLFMYYPVRFSGKSESDDKVVRDLDVTLREALTASPGFGSPVGSFLVEKLEDGEDTYKIKLGLFELLERFLHDYPSDARMYGRSIIDGLRVMAMDPRYKKDSIKEVATILDKVLQAIMAKEDDYETIAKHNFENIEPFLVSPEIEFLPKAIEFLTPWTAVKGETKMGHWVWTAVLPVLFNNINKAALKEHAMQSLEILGKWIEIYSFDAPHALVALYDKKEAAFQRVGNDFPETIYTHMHVMAKVELLTKGNATDEEVESYLRPSFEQEKNNPGARNSAEKFVQYLSNLRFDVVAHVLKHLAFQFKDDLFVNRLACSAINGKQDFQRLRKVVFKNFDQHTNVEILNLLLEQKQRAPNKYEKEVIGLTTLEWMLENVRLDTDSQFSGEHQSRLVTMTEILYYLTEDVDVHEDLNNIANNWPAYPYLALIAVKHVVQKKIDASIAGLREFWSPYGEQYDMSLRYFSILNGEPDLKHSDLKDVIDLKARALLEEDLDQKVVEAFLEKIDINTFDWDVLFDFNSIWYDHIKLGFELPKGDGGMDFRELFLHRVLHPVLEYLHKHNELLLQAKSLFKPALGLIESFVHGNMTYSQTMRKLVMDILSHTQEKEDDNLPSDSYNLMILLPDLLKHAPPKEGAAPVVQTVLYYAKKFPDDQGLVRVVMETIDNLMDLFDASWSKELLAELFEFTDANTIGRTREIRTRAISVKKKLSTSFKRR